MSFAENTNTAKKFGNKATATLTDNATGKSVDFPSSTVPSGRV